MKSDEEEAEAIADVAATRSLLRFARDRLIDAVHALYGIEDPEARFEKLDDVVKHYEKVALQAIEAERRFAKYGDGVHSFANGALDLDSAKRDVLERLARLAAARDD
ncbi:MAG: hypothetical protein AAGJ34_07095 [Pseudomonadota bacterium]